MKLFVHEEFFREYPGDLDASLQRVTWSVVKKLQESGGSTLKRLSGPWGGRAFRCRVGDFRFPLSIVRMGGEDVAVVHQAGHRSKVYDSHAFRSRLERFHTELYDQGSESWSVDPRAAGYHSFDVRVDQASEVEAQVALDPWLNDSQSRVLTGLLPFPGTWGAHDALLMMANGAPGCGKTVVAAELADVAAAVCGYQVLFLVPTTRLEVQYREWFTVLGTGAQASVELVQDFFQDQVGNQPGELDRLGRLRSAWEEFLAKPALRAWGQKNPLIRSARFLALVDGLLTTTASTLQGSRDALDAADADLYGLLADLQVRPAWLQLLSEQQYEHGVTLRCQAAGAGLSEASESSVGPLLIIVDECQDLVPAEWQALLRFVGSKWSRARQARIAMLGDEAQRISPTSFSWADLAQYCIGTLGWEQQLVQRVTLPGSYRVPREIGSIAAKVFDSPLTDLAAGRHPNILDPEGLDRGGEVSVLAVDLASGQLDDLDETLESIRSKGGGRMILVDASEAETDRWPLRASAERIPVHLAKGLEFRSIVVLTPFEHPLPMHFDRAAALYTALTRATHRVVWIVPEQVWPQVRQALANAPFRALTLKSSGERQAVLALCLDIAEATTSEEYVALLVARIEGAVNDLRLSTSHDARRAQVDHLIADVGALVTLEQYDIIFDRVRPSCIDIADFPALLNVGRADSRERRLAVLLLLGEHHELIRSLQVGTTASGATRESELAAHVSAHLTPLERVVAEMQADLAVDDSHALLHALKLLADRRGRPLGASTEPQAIPRPETHREAALWTTLTQLQASLQGILRAQSGWTAWGEFAERVDSLHSRFALLGKRARAISPAESYDS